MPLARMGVALAATLLTACTVSGTARVAVSPGPASAASKKPGASPVASLAAETAATAGPVTTDTTPPTVAAATASAAPPPPTGLAPPPRLAPPASGRLVLRGRVRIDGSYAISSGAAVISNNGGSVLSNAGAQLINDHGAAILSDAGGGLVAPDAAHIIANNGGSVISDYGMGIAPGLLANNGASMIGKTKFFALLAAGAEPQRALSEAPEGSLAGALQPAAGLVVGLGSLRRSELLAVGQDATGTDAYGVYTDADGGWEVSVPAEEAGNVLVLVRFPADPSRPATPDARLAWDLVTPTATAAEAAVDDDTSLAAQYLLSAYVNRFRDLMTTSDTDALAEKIAGRWIGAPAALRVITVALIKEFRAVADEVGLSTAPRAEAERISRQLVNSVLARVALDQVIVTKAANERWVWADERALPALAGALGHLRVKAAQALVSDPQGLDRLPFLVSANEGKRARGEATYQIRKGSDFGDFIVREYLLGELQDSYNLGTTALTAIDALVDPATGVNQVDRIAGAQSAIMTEIGRKLLLDEDGAKTEALAILRAYQRP